MKICGIIAEFNPFHNGHKYLIDQVRQQLKPDFLIVVMSGNYVQRGEMAIFDKWRRTQMALNLGVDLVIELPFQYSAASVDLFAQGAMEILNDLKCTHLVFGTENNDFDYLDAAKKIVDLKMKVIDYTKSYATQINELYYQELGISIMNPNQMLGLNYAIQIIANNYPIDVVPIQRLNVEHDSNRIVENIASASHIRLKLRERQDVSDLMPTAVNVDDIIINEQKFFDFLKYKVTVSSADELSMIYQMVEGLENRLKEVINDATSIDELLEKLKSKRYTFARLRRLMLYTVLNVKDSDIQNADNFIHILGFNNQGRGYLNQIKKDVVLPVVTKVSKKIGDRNGIMSLQIQVDNFTSLFTGTEQNFKRNPEMEI